MQIDIAGRTFRFTEEGLAQLNTLLASAEVMPMKYDFTEGQIEDPKSKRMLIAKQVTAWRGE